MPDDIVTEIWKPVVGHETIYSVSSLGRVRRETAQCNTWAGRILRPNRLASGYDIATLFDGGNRSYRRVHQLVAEAFIGPCPPNLQVNHKNGIKHDNRPENLEYITQQENIRHAWNVLKNCKARRGTASTAAKLTEEQVLIMRRMYAENRQPFHVIAEQFGVTAMTAWHIIRRNTWTHV